MNKLDSELIANELARNGFELSVQVQAADIVVFNTCSVRQHAENRVLTCLGRLAQQKAQRPGLVSALVGCMAQRQGAELLEQFGALDIVCGPGELHRLAELIKKVRAGASQQLALTERLRARRAVPTGLEELDVSRLADKGAPKAQAYVRVMRGCDKFCTYCIVPKVRGREISRSPEHILGEVKRLINAGCIEITLLGQTVNSYCYRSDGREIRFGELLRKVAALGGLKRLRFVTSHPLDFSEDIFRAMAEMPALCNYLHLPAQSGSDRILAAMNRLYTHRQYLELIKLGRTIVPDLSLAGDFIVGFPGATEQDFQDTVRLVRAAKYKNCFIFKYSPRPGTAAAKRLPDDVTTEVKRRRNNELLAVQEEISCQLHRAFVGQTVEVLVEGPSKSARKGRSEHQHQLSSRTRGDHIVVFDAPGQAAQLNGKLVQVKIRAASALTLFGELAEPE
jgi:tRNA-2-methylthio-N6-dimethylallyladenosine synthase